MALTRDFKENIKARCDRDPAFRRELIAGALECLGNNEADVARTLLRDYVNATLGFEELARITEKSRESLMRMLSPRGNPNMSNLSMLLASIKQHEGVEIKVRVR